MGNDHHRQQQRQTQPSHFHPNPNPMSMAPFVHPHQHQNPHFGQLQQLRAMYMQQQQQQMFRSQQYEELLRRRSENFENNYQQLYPKSLNLGRSRSKRNLVVQNRAGIPARRQSLVNERSDSSHRLSKTMGESSSSLAPLSATGKYSEFAKTEPSMVVDNFLYLGGYWSLYNPELLHYLGVTHVLNMAKEVPPRAQLPLPARIKVKHINASDNEQYFIMDDFERAFKFIDRVKASGGKVLVNCVMGISRSSTIVIGWLMSRYQLSLQSAYEHVRAVRPHIKPNRYFHQQLINFEQELFNPSRRFHSLSQHGSVPNIHSQADKSTDKMNRETREKKHKVKRHKSLIDLIGIQKYGNKSQQKQAQEHLVEDQLTDNINRISIVNNKKQVRFKF